jgi:hypothetical protein
VAGRPKKYKAEFAGQVEELCAIFGANDKKLAEYFKVVESTLNKWKIDYPEFSESLKKGKEKFDTENVEVSLLQRALGYEHDEEKVFCHNGDIITHNQIKHYPPDTTACIFYLKNRLPSRWKDIKAMEHSGGIKTNVSFAEGLKQIGEHFKSNPELEEDLLGEAEG